MTPNKPPLPPLSINKKSSETQNLNASFSGVRKSTSRTSLMSGERSPAKSVLSHIQVAPNLNVIDALKEYVQNNEDSSELPDPKFISEFCTYLFQTNIFKNLDAIMELLQDENVEIVNDLRKSQNFKDTLPSTVLESDLDQNSDFTIRRFEDTPVKSKADEEDILERSQIYERLQNVKQKCDKSNEYQELMSERSHLDTELKSLKQRGEIYKTQISDLKTMIKD
jgi:hypothetical protein